MAVRLRRRWRIIMGGPWSWVWLARWNGERISDEMKRMIHDEASER